jgi:hypothetical protein
MTETILPGAVVVGNAFDHSPSRAVVGHARDQGPRSPSGVGAACEQGSRSGSADDSSLAASTLPASSPPEPFSPPPTAPSAKKRKPPERPAAATGAIRELIFHHQMETRPENTRRAYNPKVIEFYQYCNQVYKNVPDTERFLLTSDNTYNFILYQAMREKKKAGGRKRKQDDMEHVASGEGEVVGAMEGEVEEETMAEGEEDEAEACSGSRGEGFNGNEYDRVMATYADQQVLLVGGDVTALKHPTNPLGFRQFSCYKGALLSLYRMQVTQNLVPNAPFESIWGNHHVSLMNLVRQRRHDVSVARFEEKMGNDATPYTQVDLIPRIEELLWKMGSGIARSQLAALRNRHAFLMTTSGILRFESLAKRNLSEIFSFTYKGSRDPHELLITMYQLPTGKFFVCFFHFNLLCVSNQPLFLCFLYPQVKLMMVFTYSVAQLGT